MAVGFRHDDLRRGNRAMVISAVRRAGQPSRTEIAGATGLSHSTISAISHDLIREGILVEVKGSDAPAAKRGRPQVALGLNPAAATVATAVLSLNHLSAALVDYAGNVVVEESRRLATLSMGQRELTGEVAAMVRRLAVASGRGTARLSRIVLSVQGITDAAGRTMLWSPITPESKVPFASALEAAFGIPTTVENDCNMIAAALRWLDPEHYGEDFVVVLLSHGIGMGMVLKGDLFTGTRSSGGEFGHMIHRPNGALCRCGRRGCVEAYAGNYAIWRNARHADGDEPPAADIDDADMLTLADQARSREGPERSAFRLAGEAIGFALGSLFALVDPAPVVFVGHGSRAFDLIEPALRDALGRTAGGQGSEDIPISIRPDEMPLITVGCAIRALAAVDQEMAAPTPATALPGRVDA